MPRSRPHRPHGDDDEGDGSPSPGGRGRPHGGSENVAAAQGTLSAKLAEGRPGEGRLAPEASAEGQSATRAAASAEPPSAREFVDGIAEDPMSVAGRSAQDLADQFTAAGFPATVEQS